MSDKIWMYINLLNIQLWVYGYELDTKYPNLDTDHILALLDGSNSNIGG
jgi:hypothetical protein